MRCVCFLRILIPAPLKCTPSGYPVLKGSACYVETNGLPLAGSSFYHVLVAKSIARLVAAHKA